MNRTTCGIVFAAGLLLAGQAHAANINLTPISNQGGQLPSGYEVVSFVTYDGNWISDISLPQKPRNGDRVQIQTNASYPSMLGVAQTNLNVPQLQMTPGQTMDFVYSTTLGRWQAAGSQVANMTPSLTGNRIPDTHPRVSIYEMGDGNWTSNVTLPAVAKDGDVVAINSSAAWGAQINPANILFASTLSIGTGDRYSFVFRGDLNKWLLRTAPTDQPAWTQTNVLQLARPTRPRTLVTLADGRWAPRVVLPAQAGDRDRIIIRSTAAYGSVIGSEYTNSNTTTRLFPGAEYEYIFTREYNRWELVASPTDTYDARQIANGMMPPLRTPTTLVRFADANWVPTLTLPAGHGAYTRVVVDTSAAYGVQVVAGSQRHSISTGELVSFIVDNAGNWQRETRTIDLLLLYSNKIASSIGDSAARARMYESFNLTNEALANSGANFRYRMMGLRKFDALANWTQLGHPLDELRSNAIAQAWRNEVRADGIYYEGTEEGCGLAWINADAYSMVGTGSVACGTGVMRHEMGHNMGLDHGGTPTAGYRQGYLPARTIMAGNAIPFYATPWRLERQDGIWMGIDNQFDAVRAMNERSATVAAFR